MYITSYGPPSLNELSYSYLCRDDYICDVESPTNRKVLFKSQLCC